MVVLERLNEVEFVDLFLGPDYCEVFREAPCGESRRVPLPDSHAEVIPALRDRCEAQREECQGDEFSLLVGGTRYRVTTTFDSRRRAVYVLRKASASLRRLPELGLSPFVIRTVLDPELEGLVVVVGGPGDGKTSTVATIVAERIRRFGGAGQTIEQPIEVNLEGLHGEHGRIVQEEIFHEVDYAQSLVKAMRITSRVVMMGELRHPAAALQAIIAGISGKLVITTLHGKSVEDGIERLVALAAAASANTPINPYTLLTSGLKLVIHQSLVPSADSVDAPKRLVTRALSLADDALRPAIQAKIRDGRISALNQEIEQQQQQSTWRPGVVPGGRA